MRECSSSRKHLGQVDGQPKLFDLVPNQAFGDLFITSSWSWFRAATINMCCHLAGVSSGKWEQIKARWPRRVTKKVFEAEKVDGTEVLLFRMLPLWPLHHHNCACPCTKSLLLKPNWAVFWLVWPFLCQWAWLMSSFRCSYQYGPDTYLLQVKDPDFPARLREYLNVAKQTSAEFQDVKVSSPNTLNLRDLHFEVTLALLLG